MLDTLARNINTVILTASASGQIIVIPGTAVPALLPGTLVSTVPLMSIPGAAIILNPIVHSIGPTVGIALSGSVGLTVGWGVLLVNKLVTRPPRTASSGDLEKKIWRLLSLVSSVIVKRSYHLLGTVGV